MKTTVDVLRSCELFDGIDDHRLEVIAELAHLDQLEDGQLIFEEGNPRQDLFVIAEGHLGVSIGDGAGTQILLGPGEAVGEAALVDPSRHTATVRARGRARVLRCEVAAVLETASGDPRALHRLLSNVTTIIVRRFRFAAYRRVGWEEIYRSGITRREHDLLGEREVPDDARYGVQTMRAMENFDITGVRLGHYAHLVRALAMVKQAAARANRRLGLLDEDVAEAIDAASQEIIDGHWHGHFVVDVVQGGAGTSTNMNANEVIANRALELLGHRRGDYEHCHPNNHVNLSQSTNDVYPTAVRVAVIQELDELLPVLEDLDEALAEKGREFADVLKMGRTQLQDAVPMTVGQEFEAFAVTTAEDIARLRETAQLFLEVNLGGTAIGTGINADPRYPKLAVEELAAITGLDFVLAPNLVEATPDTGAFVMFSGVLKRVAVKLSKLCNDLRLLSSGPRCGLNEINLPAMQPGSSIMPGKVNPVIPEVVNQIAFQVIGNDLTITMAAEAGQLQLNVMEPIITSNLFESLDMLTAGVRTLTERCVRGITVNSDHCRAMVESSIGIVTALVPVVGYERAGEIAVEALKSGRSVREVVLETADIGPDEIDRLLSPETMTKPKELN
jgi:aspartate ammonia-lyase